MKTKTSVSKLFAAFVLISLKKSKTSWKNGKKQI